jgi:hypothetical protein
MATTANSSRIVLALSYAAAGALFFVFGLGSCVNFGSAPTAATPYYIDEDRTYYSPPMIPSDERSFGIRMGEAEAFSIGFAPLDDRIAQATAPGIDVYVNPTSKRWVLREDPRGHVLVTATTRAELLTVDGRIPDAVHRNYGGFQDWCGPITWILRKLGISSPRFGPTGEWNW